MRVFHLLDQAHRAVFRSSDQRLRDAEGISTAQLSVMLILAEEDGLTMTTLAQRTGQSASSLSGLVDRMAAKGLVRRSNEERDGRVQIVHLEPSGRSIIGRCLPYIATVNEALLDPFDAAERSTIERFLNHVTDSSTGTE